MHLHILGICGTFMGGIAQIARQLGHRVTGCDSNVYPPMSTQLQQCGIELVEGFDPEQTKLKPDVFVIGNVISRGNPLVEEILNQNLGYISGPQWLAENVLKDRWVLACAGTHGKTTTASILAWILEDAGLAPGFLIGGVPINFEISARLSGKTKSENDKAYSPPPFFVIEADEYDTAFFDKRSKFVHYRPRTLILNNLEFDHADIFPNLAAIEKQFHHLVRIVPTTGLIVANAESPALQRVLDQGCWTPVEYFGSEQAWSIESSDDGAAIRHKDKGVISLKWELMGEHNQLNALAALLAARHVGVPIESGALALSKFKNVKRRMEVRGRVNDITLYDDFAHHPTAIAATLAGLRKRVGNARIIAVLEPRSNTMRMGVLKEEFAPSLDCADVVFCYAANLGWDPRSELKRLGDKAEIYDDLNQLISKIVIDARKGDHILIMSNGGFGGIHDKLLQCLK